MTDMLSSWLSVTTSNTSCIYNGTSLFLENTTVSHETSVGFILMVITTSNKTVIRLLVVQVVSFFEDFASNNVVAK